MLLQNLMEDKQLDFNRPLLSIRRTSSGQTSESDNRVRSCDSVPKLPPLPDYKSDFKSGPIRDPGTVPFQWERKPGKPKDESKSDFQGLDQPHFVPKPPPGRTLNVKQRESGKTVSLSTRAGSGRLNSHSYSDKNGRKYESAKDIAEDTRRSSSEHYDDDEGEDDNDVYLDATDALSRSESFFLNCSVSGVSALDGPELQPSGIFSSDPQTRDLMMGRFLPAAKAMASEAPPYHTRRPPVPQEQPIPRMKVVQKGKRQTIQPNPNYFQHLQYQQEERWEESEDEDESDRPDSKMAGVCGLFPQICLKSSLGLLSPVPGVRTQVQRAVSVRRLRSKYPDFRPCCENENKPAKGAQDGLRSTVGCQRVESHEDKKKVTLQVNQSVFGTQRLDGSDLQGPLNPEGKEKIENFRVSPDCSHNKAGKNFGELLASDDNRWESCPGSPVAEKTLYVDTVHKVKFLKTDTSSLDSKEKADSKDHPLEGCASLDCPVKDVQHVLNARESPPKSHEQMNDSGEDGSLVHEFTESKCPEVVENQRARSENEAPKKQCKDEGPYEHDLAIIPLPVSGVPESRNEKINVETSLQKSSTTPEGSNGHYPPWPVPPPLPKAPSDSWLKRTLPTISSKHSSIWPSLGTDNYTKIQAFLTKTSDPKWEMMVKKSNTQRVLMHFSKDKLDRIPEA